MNLTEVPCALCALPVPPAQGVLGAGFRIQHAACPSKAATVAKPLAHAWDADLAADKGLGFCTVCKAAEGTLTKDCPGAPVADEVQRRVYAAEVDYVAGAWVPGRGPRQVKISVASHGVRVPGALTGPRTEAEGAAGREPGNGSPPSPAKVLGAVTVSLIGGRLQLAPVEPMAQDAMNAYRETARLAGAKGSGQKLAAYLSDAERIKAALEAVGLLVRISPAVTAALAARAANLTSEHALTEDRCRAINERMERDGEKLHAYQIEGSLWLAAHDSGILGDPPGSGKTRQCLGAIPNAAPVVVIAPAVAKDVWLEELKKYRPDLSPALLRGREAFQAWPEAGQALILNYEIMPEAWPGNPPPGLVILVDECQRVQNPAPVTTKRVKALCKLALEAGGRAWGVSGTPMRNHAGNLYTVLSAFGLERVFKSAEHYRRLWKGYKDPWGKWVWGAPDPEVPRRLKRAFLARDEAVILPQLPPITFKKVTVDIDAKTRATVNEAMAALGKLGVSLDAAIEEAARTRQGAAFEELSKAHAALNATKVPAVFELIKEYEDAGEPALVFSPHAAPAEAFLARPGWAVITGQVSQHQRKEIRLKFQAGELKGIACTIKAAGVALTLTRARYAIFCGETWVPADNEQAWRRLYRLGQTRPCLVTTVVAAHDLDYRVHEINAVKAAAIKASVGAALTAATPPDPPDQPLAPASRLETWLMGHALPAIRAHALARNRPELEIEASALLGAGSLSQEQAHQAMELAKRFPKLCGAAPDSRPASGHVEAWAAKSLATLAASELWADDRDRLLGKQLAQQLADHGGLSRWEWPKATTLCRRYVAVQAVGSPEAVSQAVDLCRCGEPAVAWDAKLDKAVCDKHRARREGGPAAWPSPCCGVESRLFRNALGKLEGLRCNPARNGCGTLWPPSATDLERDMRNHVGLETAPPPQATRITEELFPGLNPETYERE